MRENKFSKLISALFASADPDEIKRNIAQSNMAYFNSIARFENVPENSDFWDDLYWFAEAQQEFLSGDYPCIHMAYACSPAGGPSIAKQHNLYSILHPTPTTTIVIGNCPWCGIELNNAAS